MKETTVLTEEVRREGGRDGEEREEGGREGEEEGETER